VTLLELVVVLAIVGIMAAMAAPVGSRWAENQRLATSVRNIETAFSYARGEATRTGNIFAVFVDEDADGNTLTSPIVVLDDGRPGAAGQNCDIDRRATRASPRAGVRSASPRRRRRYPRIRRRRPGNIDFGRGRQRGQLGPVPAEGFPLAFSSDCSTGAVGTGGGGLSHQRLARRGRGGDARGRPASTPGTHRELGNGP
jgi:type II secretory pathway pseudopilin PulG